MATSDVASRKSRRENSASGPVGDELPSSLLSLLGRSPVLHTGAERAVRETFGDAIAPLPFSSAEATRLLVTVAASDATVPFVSLRMGRPDAVMLFLAPLYPPLRALSVSNAVRAWVLVDMLCLDAAAHRLEDNIVQRRGPSRGGKLAYRPYRGWLPRVRHAVGEVDQVVLRST